jgi:hypothetical protein
MGDTLKQINSIKDWEKFLPLLDRIPVADPKWPGGRPRSHPMFMFKILIPRSANC